MATVSNRGDVVFVEEPRTGAAVLILDFGVRRARSALGFLEFWQAPYLKILKRSELSALQIRNSVCASKQAIADGKPFRRVGWQLNQYSIEALII